MRWRPLTLVSVGLNVALAVGGVLLLTRRAGKPPEPLPTLAGPLGTNLIRTNVIIRRQFFTWREVESPDYPTYIANLRDIGCPESTIRDIIVADVDQLYALKRATEIVTAQQQWWRSEPDPELIRTAEAKLRALDDERRALLTRLLGPKWEVTEPDFTALRRLQAIALDGPVLGVLPADVKRQVRQIAVRQQQQLQDYLTAERNDGRNPDPAALARIRKESHDALARILTPAQLEEFLLRYSDTAQALRNELGQLKYFSATPDEFRSLFRSLDSLENQYDLAVTGAVPLSAAQQAALEQQRDSAIREALGDKRYEEFRRLHDPAYRDALAAATAAGAPQAVETLYEINRATAEERRRIEADTNLTAQLRDVELKQMELEQAKANALALGQTLPADSTPPPPQPPTPTPPPRIFHIMAPGETIGALSTRYGVPVRDILAANDNRDISVIKPGDLIIVPRAPSGQQP